MDDTQQVISMLQDVLRKAEQLAAERDVYKQLIDTAPDLRATADAYFAGPAYADKLKRYNSLRTKAMDALSRRDHDGFAESIGAFAGELNRNQNPIADSPGPNNLSKPR